MTTNTYQPGARETRALKRLIIRGLWSLLLALCQVYARNEPMPEHWFRQETVTWITGGAPEGPRSRRQEGGSRPISRVLSWATIPLGCTSPCTSSSLPGNTRGPRAAGRSELQPTCFPIWPCSGRGLPCRPCYQRRGALLPHPFTLTSRGRTRGFGGLLSVALSVGSRPPGVTWRPALWSPDFPPADEPRAVAWPTPAHTIGPAGHKLKHHLLRRPAGASPGPVRRPDCAAVR